MKLSMGDIDKLESCFGRCKGCLEEDCCELQVKLVKYPELRVEIPKPKVSTHISSYVKKKYVVNKLKLK